MKNLYFSKTLIVGLLLISAISVKAQELIVGGDMEEESASNWTIVDLAPGNGHTETFGYTDDSPKGGEDGCLSLTGSGNWSNVAVCQEITISRGYDYQISMVVKTSLDFIPENDWVEIVVVPSMPAVDADITSHPNVLALNSWDCSDVTHVDGNFAVNNCDAKSALNDILNIDGKGDTTVVLVLKAGGNNEYNVLLDNVSVLDLSAISVKANTLNPALDVYPNPVDNELNVRLDKQIQAIKILNVLGQTVYSAENIRLYNVKINFSAPAAGLYLGVVTDLDGNKSMFKTLKQ